MAESALSSRKPLQAGAKSIAPWESVYQRLTQCHEAGIDLDEKTPEIAALKQELSRIMQWTGASPGSSPTRRAGERSVIWNEVNKMINFFKMSGSGNDFILIDNRDGSLALGDVDAFAKRVCTRKVSVGADGLIIIERSDRVDFRWRFFNADGSEVEMCGNGGRCAARFAFLQGIAKEKMSFETGAGVIDAEVTGDVVKLRLTDPRDLIMNDRIRIKNQIYFVNSVNTGVPHAVHFLRDLDAFDVFGIGRAIRNHEHYRPAGTNADFVTVVDDRTLRVRTYERGVEDETLACGTGSVASALIAAAKGLVASPVDVLVRSGERLRIYFEKTQEGFTNVYLEGKATVVYQGALWDEAWKSM